MGKARTFLKLLLINGAIFVVVAELLGVGFYYFSQGRLFYTDENVSVPSDLLEGVPQVLTTKLHPYFGFVTNSGQRFADRGERGAVEQALRGGVPTETDNIRSNSHGFYSPYDYPYAPENRETYIVAIIGGSVAQQLALEGADRLARGLGSRGRPVVVLNLAQGGFKQPQQLIVLAYYLALGQRLDAVINIDGFNEVALSNLNIQEGVSVAMPSVRHMLVALNLSSSSGLSNDQFDAFFGMYRYKSRLNRVEGMLSRNPSAAGYYGLQILYGYLSGRYYELSQRFESLSTATSDNAVVHLDGVDEGMAEGEFFDRMAQQWARSSVTMAGLLHGQGIAYLHVLQPNQYFTEHEFSEAESRIALHDESIYRIGAERGYPKLLEWVPFLRERGVNFESAVPLFDVESEIVFSDSCCHFNTRGNDMLVDFILEHWPGGK